MSRRVDKEFIWTVVIVPPPPEAPFTIWHCPDARTAQAYADRYNQVNHSDYVAVIDCRRVDTEWPDTKWPEEHTDTETPATVSEVKRETERETKRETLPKRLWARDIDLGKVP